MSKIIFTLLILLLPKSVFAVDVAIVNAAESESAYIRQTLTNSETKCIDGLTYIVGKIDNKDVVLVKTGIGSVNSAIVLTKLLHDFSPHYILFSGSSGMVNMHLNIGDVVLARKVYSLDYGEQNSSQPIIRCYENNPIRHTLDPVIFLGNEKLLSLAHGINLDQQIFAHDSRGTEHQAKVFAGVIASSDHFPNTGEDMARMQRNSVDVVDMEGVSVLKTCWIFHRDCLLIRGISNVAGPNVSNPYLQWNIRNRALAENNAGEVTVKIIKEIH